MLLLKQTTIAEAVAGQVGSAIAIPPDAKALLIEAQFVRAGGGTTVKAWVQTRIKDGTWRDIACFAFLTTTLTKFCAVRMDIALAPATLVSDGALTDDTILDGLLGDEMRVKYTTTGTYTGASHLTLLGTVKR